MKKDNDNAKEKHAKSNSKHQKAVALRTQWLKDNPDKKKEDWDYAIHLKAMNEKFTVKFKEEKTRFLTQPSAKVSPRTPAKFALIVEKIMISLLLTTVEKMGTP